ncbi:MAG: hypothetical protein LC798_05755 [Chloroflexi bacterium]|nr:hypothetical protein [Chloroflexota bacterium]
MHFTTEAQGSFDALHPGKLTKDVQATVRHSMRMEVPDIDLPDLPPTIDGVPTRQPGHDPIPNPLHNGVVVNIEGIPLNFGIFDPDGQPFTREDVTLADLKRFRDKRGKSRPWSYKLAGKSKTYALIEAFNETVGEPEGAINLALSETVASTSAAPLVPRTRLDGSRMRLTFDLNRVGTFVANLGEGIFDRWRGSMRLLDPDGGVVGRTTSERLRCAIPLSALGKSRDAAGNPRLWTLEVSPQGGVVVGNRYVTATVLGEGRLRTSALHDRIQRIFGPDGTFVKIAGAKSSGYAEVHLTISDVTAAESIDMHDLLDSRLKSQGLSTDVVSFEPMRIYRRSSDLGYGASVDASNISTTSIRVSVGPALHLEAGTPALHLAVGVAGAVTVRWGPLTLATATAKVGVLEAEVGMRIDPDGTPKLVSWFPDELFDIDFHPGAIAAFVAAAIAAAAAVGGPVGALGGLIGGSVSAAVVEEVIEDYLNDTVAEGAKKMFDDPTMAPRILMTLLGTHLTYRPIRFDGDDILLEHIAPLEPDPKPRPNYAGAIGRSPLEMAAGHTMFMPRTLGDTWVADNLRTKIKHIVVVMMENRSYDHVLGYRAIAPTDPRDEANGWTPELIDAVNARADQFRPPPPPAPRAGQEPTHHDTQPPVGPMRNSAFELNHLQLRTRLPLGVGHDLTDRNTGEPVDELPMFGFLAEQYGYCDRFFCSHPGPTLPNRMFSLTGDVQYDRYGFPILDNNDSDNFLLSRAQTIYDVLTKHGVSWRVYESAPSVTMLRMFARYASDDENIRPIEDFYAQAAAGQLPSFVVVEPAMHHHPQDDDHPDADMSRGQRFIWKAYDALTKNQAAWNETLLLITYDEHGGFYDHVIPPIADVFEGQGPVVADPGRDPVVSGDPETGGLGGVRDHRGGTRVGGLGGVRGGVLGDVLDGGFRPVPELVEVPVHVPYGARVPTFVVSPWTPPGKGPSITLDHCSIVKTVLARFCPDTKPFFSDRVNASLSFESYLSEPQPRAVTAPVPEPPDIPITAPRMASSTSEIVTEPLFRKRMRSEQVDYHEISGRLARMLGR